jgi:ATP-dependent Clp protease adaptor protein ClpS
VGQTATSARDAPVAPRSRAAETTAATTVPLAIPTSRRYRHGIVGATQERTDRGTGSGLGDAWKVIVLNDDHNTFEGVAAALAAVVPGTDFARGMELASRIHNTGRAIVWSGLQEQAELYWEQLDARGLTMAPLER